MPGPHSSNIPFRRCDHSPIPAPRRCHPAPATACRRPRIDSTYFRTTPCSPSRSHRPPPGSDCRHWSCRTSPQRTHRRYAAAPAADDRSHRSRSPACSVRFHWSTVATGRRMSPIHAGRNLQMTADAPHPVHSSRSPSPASRHAHASRTTALSAPCHPSGIARSAAGSRHRA